MDSRATGKNLLRASVDAIESDGTLSQRCACNLRSSHPVRSVSCCRLSATLRSAYILKSAWEACTGLLSYCASGCRNEALRPDQAAQTGGSLRYIFYRLTRRFSSQLGSCVARTSRNHLMQQDSRVTSRPQPDRWRFVSGERELHRLPGGCRNSPQARQRRSDVGNARFLSWDPT